ncbi:2-hydroxyacid dehydrogenase [Streptomyces sp. NPDC004539]|uniref:2-hydroxyacid dehydrogenase n=1 Tax=Streptomyces sp. NPDC004539 TaxID=3154280 RepID=UPI0033B56857
MRGLTVVVADPHLRRLREEFEAAMPPGTTVRWPEPEETADALTDADVLVSGTCPAALARAGSKLRLVHAAGAGTDGIDVTALPPGTLVANTFHHEDAIAEYVVAATILLRRGLIRQDAALRRGEWEAPSYPGLLGEATVGFVGFGHIGARTWQLLRPFGTRGVAVTRRGQADAVTEHLDRSGGMADLDALLDTSDVVVVSVPLTPGTTSLIAAKELARMKDTAILVNVGRGRVVDEDALYDALRDGAIGGAALDVWYDYPDPGGHGRPSRHPFHELPNTLMTPHSSGLARQTFTRRTQDIAVNVRRLAAGQDLSDVVAVAR